MVSCLSPLNSSGVLFSFLWAYSSFAAFCLLCYFYFCIFCRVIASPWPWRDGLWWENVLCIPAACSLATSHMCPWGALCGLCGPFSSGEGSTVGSLLRVWLAVSLANCFEWKLLATCGSTRSESSCELRMPWDSQPAGGWNCPHLASCSAWGVQYWCWQAGSWAGSQH